MKRKKKIAALLAAALSLSLLAGCGGGAASVVYLTAENELELIKGLDPDADSIELTDRAADPDVFKEDKNFLAGQYLPDRSIAPSSPGAMFWPASDEKSIYFLARIGYSTASLYLADISQLKADSAKNDSYIEKVDSGIAPNSVRQAGEGILYEKQTDNGWRLYYHNGKESIKLIDGSWIEYHVTEDGAGILYNQYIGDGSGKSTLYYLPFSEDGEREKLAIDVRDFFYTDGKILFLKWNDGKYDVYTTAPGEESTKLLSGAEEIKDVWGTSFYYTTIQEREIPVSTLVEGELDPDYLNNLPFVEESDFHVDIDSSTIEKLQSIVNSDDSYDQWWRTQWMGSDSSYNYIANTRSAKFSDENKARYKNYIREYCASGNDYLTDWDSYYAAVNERDRLAMRYQEQGAALKRTYSVRDTALCFYNGTEGHTVSDCISTESAVTTDARQKFALYQNLLSEQEIEKINVNDIDDISDVFSWYDYKRLNTGSSQWNYTIGPAAENSVELEGNWLFVGLLNGGKQFVIQSHENDELLAYPVQDGKLGKAVSIAEDVPTYQVSEDKTTIYYYENADDTQGDLCRYRGGDPETLASDVSRSNFEATSCIYSDGVTLALRDLGPSGGTLLRFEKGNGTRVADDVTYYLRLDERNILYLSSGNLYLYNGKEKERLSSDVALVWSPDAMTGQML